MVLLCMALCHTIVIDRNGEYSSASPDELALVDYAKKAGCEFLGRDTADNVSIQDREGKRVYKLLNVCEFTSTRKRMSCVYQEPSGSIKLLCKGADTVMAERASEACKASGKSR